MSHRSVNAIAVLIVALSASIAWEVSRPKRINTSVLTGTARRPLVVINGKTTAMPAGDYLAANTLVDTTGCSSANVITWSGTQFACAPPSGGGGGLLYHDSTLRGSGSATDPTGLALCGSNAVWVMNGSGTGWGCSASNSVAPGAGSLSITKTITGTTTVALDTIGTIDWIYASSWWANSATDGGGSPTGCNGLAGGSNSCQMKNGGGGILGAAGLQWLSPPGTPTSTSSNTTFTSASSDNTADVSLSTTFYKCQASSTFPNGHWGFKFNLPSFGNNVPMVARVYLFQYDDAVTCTATSTDGSTAGSSMSNDTGSGSIVNTVTWTVSYQTNLPTPISFVCRATVLNTGTGSPAFCWGAVALSHT